MDNLEKKWLIIFIIFFSIFSTLVIAQVQPIELREISTYCSVVDCETNISVINNVRGWDWWSFSFKPRAIEISRPSFASRQAEKISDVRILSEGKFLPSRFTLKPGENVITYRGKIKWGSRVKWSTSINYGGRTYELDPWWNSSWQYRKPINITSIAGNLTDYQVAINITFVSGKMNSSFQDLRFTYYNSTSQTETEIPYWIESKVDSSWAYTWVKVPFLQNASFGNNTIYMYYGNSQATSKSNGTETFIFFDTIEDGTNWNFWGQPVGIVDSTTGNPAPSLKGNGDGYYESGAVMKTQINISQGIALIFDFKHSSTLRGGAGGFSNQSSFTAVDWFYGCRVSTLANIFRGEGSLGNASFVIRASDGTCESSSIALDGTVWRKQEIQIEPNYGKVRFLIDDILRWTSTKNIKAQDGWITISGHDSPFWYDNFKVRKYSSPEPTPSIGPEEAIQKDIEAAILYSDASVNSTLAGSPVEFKLKWVDESGAGLSGYIFSLDNCTGNFVDYPWTTWANITQHNQTQTINITGNASTTDQSIINNYLNVNADGLTWDVTEIITETKLSFITPTEAVHHGTDTPTPTACAAGSLDSSDNVYCSEATADKNEVAFVNSTHSVSIPDVATITNVTICTEFYLTNKAHDNAADYSAVIIGENSTGSWSYTTIDSRSGTAGSDWYTEAIRCYDVSNIINTVAKAKNVRISIYHKEGDDTNQGPYVDWNYVNITYTVTTYSLYSLAVEHNATISYSGNLNSINVSINFTSTIDDIYNMTIYNFASSSWDVSSCQNVSVTANNYYTIWCNVTTNPANYISSTGEVRVRLNSTPDSDRGTLKEEYVQFYITSFPIEAWSSATKVINSTIGCPIKWKFYAKNLEGLGKTSDIYIFNTTENIPPKYNDTGYPLYSSREAGMPVEFRMKWTDDTSLSGYIFSFDNCTGNFMNDSWTEFTSTMCNMEKTECWSNVTKVISFTPCTIKWKFYANDTSNNWNATETYSIYTTQACNRWLEVNLTNPFPETYTETNPKEVLQNNTFVINATVKCRAAVSGCDCSDLTGKARYNSSSTTMDLINTTTGSTPFYIISESNPITIGNLGYNQQVQVNWTVNATGPINSIWRVDVQFSGENVPQNDTDDSFVKIIGLNTPPSVSALIIKPDVAYTNDNLTCNATLTDGEQTSLTAYFRWYKNYADSGISGSISVANNTNTLISTLLAGNTTKGENWTCEITPYDGTINGTAVNSSVRNISNSLPSITSVSITPSLPITTDNLNCSASGYSDADNDAAQYYFKWYKNGVLNLSVGPQSQAWHVLNSGNTSKNENWKCGVIPFDGEANGTQVNSTSVTIQNSAPTQPTSLTPETGIYGGTNNIVLISCSGSNDADDDAINYSIDAYYDGSWHSLEYQGDGSYSWDVSGISSQTGVDLRCNATDLTAYSNYYNPDGTLTIDNTAPSYSLNSTNSTLAGTAIEFRLKWADNVGLSKAITSIWNGSSWVNASTWCDLSGTSSWCNQTLVVNSTPQQLWWKQYANDTLNNWNVSENFSLITTPLNVAPTLSNAKKPADPSIYSLGANYQFNVTTCDDNGATDLNIILFEFNTTGLILGNSSVTTYSTINTTCREYYIIKTDLGAGTYSWKWYVNDSANAWAIPVSGTFTINKATPLLSIGPLTSVTYGIATQTGCARISGDPSSTLTLYRNGTQVATGTVSPINETSIVLGAGTYNYTCTISETQNYTAGSLTEYRTINKANNILSSLTCSPSSTVNYPTQTTCTGNQTLAGDDDVVYYLYRNDNLVDQKTNSNPSETITLGAGSYIYKFNSSEGQNYTANTTGLSLTLTVNKGDPSPYLSIYIDGSPTSKTIVYPDIANVSANETITGDADCIYTLWRNDTQLVNGSNVWNATRLGNGTYAFKYNMSGTCSNWSLSSSQILYLYVNKGIPDVKTYIDYIGENKTVTYPTEVTIKGNSTTTITPPTFNLYIGSVFLGSGNPVSQAVTMGAGTYNIIYNTSGNENWTAATNNTIYLIVNKAATSISLYLNDSLWTSDETRVYPNATKVNATINVSELQPYVKLQLNGSDVLNPHEILLGVGTYNYTGKFEGNENYTASSFTRFLTISSKSSSCSLTFNPSSPQVYGTQITASCSCTNPEAIAKLYRNGTDIISENNNPIRLPAGYWEYVCNVSATQNYTSATNSSFYRIEKANVQPTLSITPEGWTYIYPTQTTVSCSVESINNEVSCMLWRDGTRKDSSETITLGAGNYVYKTNTSETANYTANSTGESKTLTIQQNQTNPIDIYINNGTIYKNQDVTITYGTSVTINSTLVYPDSGIALLWKNDSPVSNPYTAVLDAGIYVFKGNTSGNLNYTANDTGRSQILIVNRASASCSLSSSSGWSITYPSSTNISCTCTGDGITHLYRDGILVDAENGVEVTLAAKPEGYNYVCNITQGTNYNSASASNTLIVNKGTLSLSITPQQTVTYPTQTTVTGTEANSGDADVIYQLWRDASLITQTSPYTETIILGAGTYTYRFNATGGQNWTANSTGVTTFVTVNKGPTLVRLFLNGTEENRDYNVGETANFTVTVNVSGKIVYLNTNISGWVLQSGITPLYNYTILNTPGYYNITGYFPGDDNYTASSKTYFANVKPFIDTSPPLWSNNITYPTSPTSYSPTRTYQFNVTWVDPESAISSVLIEHNFTGILDNYTISTAQNNVYYYSYPSLPAGTYVWREYANNSNNYWNRTYQWLYIVNKASRTIDVTFDKPSPQPYGTSLRVGCAVSAGSNDGRVSLYRNGTDVTATEKDQAVVLPVGTWEYTCNITEGQNYTEASKTEYFTIERAGVNIDLWLNGELNSDNQITSTTQANATAIINVTGLNFVLYKNGTSVGTQVGNKIEYLELLPVGTWNFTAYFPGNENYSSFTRTNYLTVIREDIAPPSYDIWDLNTTLAHYGESVLVYSRWSDDVGLDQAWIETNASGYFENISVPIISDWANYTITSNARGIIAVRTWVNDTSGKLNSTTQKTFESWRWSNVTVVSPEHGSAYNISENITILCKVTDSNTSDALADYLVEMFIDDSRVKSELTNTSGYVSYEWDTDYETPGNHSIKCKIGHDAEKYYNASDPEDEVTINLGTSLVVEIVKKYDFIYRNDSYSPYKQNIIVRVKDEQNNSIENANVSFYDLSGQIGSCLTNSSGYCSYDEFNPPDTVKPYKATIWINATKENYNAAITKTVSFEIRGILFVNIDAPVELKYYKNDTVLLKASVRDENFRYQDATVNWYNSADELLASGEDTSWTIPINYKVGIETLNVTAIKSYFDPGFSTKSIEIWGWSNVNWISPIGQLNIGASVTILCNVTDANTSAPIKGYPVEFYFGENLLGSASTDVSGKATYSTTLPSTEGIYTYSCKITDALYYESYLDQAQTNISVVAPTYVDRGTVSISSIAVTNVTRNITNITVPIQNITEVALPGRLEVFLFAPKSVESGESFSAYLWVKNVGGKEIKNIRAILSGVEKVFSLDVGKDITLAFELLAPKNDGSFNLDGNVSFDKTYITVNKTIKLEYYPLFVDASAEEYEKYNEVLLHVENFDNSTTTEININRGGRTVYLDFIKGAFDYKANLTFLKVGEYEVVVRTKYGLKTIDEDRRTVSIASVPVVELPYSLIIFGMLGLVIIVIAVGLKIYRSKI